MKIVHAFVEFDSGRTAFLNIDMEIDFYGRKGYAEIMGYDLSLTSVPIKPIRHVLNTIRKGMDIKVIHSREGYLISRTHHIIKSYMAKSLEMV